MKPIIYAIFIFFFTLYFAKAQNIPIIARDLDRNGISNVRFNLCKVGITSSPTTFEGRTELKLPFKLDPGTNIELTIINNNERWRFISPLDGRIIIPAIGDYINVYLISDDHLDVILKMVSFCKPKMKQKMIIMVK